MGVAKLDAVLRDQKGYKVRRENFIPGILYGKDIESTSVKFEKIDVERLIREQGIRARINVVLDNKKSFGIIKNVDKDTITGDLYHLDIQLVSLKEEISLDVPVIFKGTDALMYKKLILQQNIAEVRLTGSMNLIPETIEFDVSDMENGNSITISDMELPEGIKCSEADETVIAAITMSKVGKTDEKTEDGSEDSAADE